MAKKRLRISEVERFRVRWAADLNAGVSPESVSVGSRKVFWWRCQEDSDHVWQSCPHELAKKCPICRPLIPKYEDSLAALFPLIAGQLDPDVKGQPTAEHLYPQSNKLLDWRCPSGHPFSATVQHRTKYDKQCPECLRLGLVSHRSGKRQTSLKYNLATEFPNVAKELHPSLNGDISPYDIAPKTSKSFYWICSRNSEHVWQTSVSNRTRLGSQCPYCFNQTSKNELRIFAELRAIFSVVQHRNRSQGLELDVWIKSLGVGVEYDGSYWHSIASERDSVKKQHFRKRRVHLIRVREQPLPIETKLDLPLRGEVSKQTIDSILGLIVKIASPTKRHMAVISRYTAGSSFWDDDGYQSLLAGRNTPPHERSLAAIPEVAKAWHSEKNDPLTPADVWAGSNDYAWFSCEICETPFRAKINKRVSAAKYVGKCKRCVAMLKGSSRLKQARPKLFAQLAPGLNPGIDLNELRCRSNRVVWWRCPKNKKHLWQASVSHRFEGTKCPFCSNKIIDSENSLLARRPQLARRWDKQKNGDLTPNQVAPSSGKTVWWTCPRNRQHSFEASICNMVRNPSACPYCNGKKVNETNSLEALFPKIAAEWHPTKNKPLMPSQVATQSGKKVWWRCGKNPRHAWQMTVQRRVVRGTGCPKCRAAKKK